MARPVLDLDVGVYVQHLLRETAHAIEALTHLRADLDIVIRQVSAQQSHLEVLAVLLGVPEEEGRE